MTGLDSFREDLRSLVAKFEKDKSHYLSKGYPEAQPREDFLNPLFKAVGWDLENKDNKPPHERELRGKQSQQSVGSAKRDTTYELI